MKKHRSQVVVAVVCALLGFLLSYQYKEIVVTNYNQQTTDYSNTEIINQVESLEKEKEELIKRNEELSGKLAVLEEDATAEGEIEKEIKSQLDTARMQLGLLDATGPGISLTMNLKSNMFSTVVDNSSLISDNDLVTIVNTLWFSKAEAISINGYRITPQTGIKKSGDYIWIGNVGRIIPSEEIKILAIGDITQMISGLKFQNLTYGNFSNYDVKQEELDSVVIEKTNQSLRSDYITTIIKNEGGE